MWDKVILFVFQNFVQHYIYYNCPFSEVPIYSVLSGVPYFNIQKVLNTNKVEKHKALDILQVQCYCQN